MSNQTVCLVSPIHDPNARLLKQTIKYLPILKKIFNNLIAISVTSKTSPKIIKQLKKNKINFEFQPLGLNGTLGDDIINSIRLGLKTSATHFHFIDFDRALHWTNRFPEELENLAARISPLTGYISMIRTERAFETHPFIQRSTETPTNSIATEIIGKKVDIMSGSFALDRKTAEIVVQNSKQKNFGIYAEILMLAFKNHQPINSLEVEGLEWETPDQFENEIDKEGYVAWLNKFESPQEWQKRVNLIESSVKILIK
jgi:hypothetical protein